MSKNRKFVFSQTNWIAGWRGSVEESTTCPYNPTHVMPLRRLLTHIIQCEKKHPELSAKFTRCPYNTLHRLTEDDLQEHLKTCQEHELHVHSRVSGGKRPYVEKNKGSTDTKPMNGRDGGGDIRIRVQTVQERKKEIEEMFEPEYIKEWNS